MDFGHTSKVAASHLLWGTTYSPKRAHLDLGINMTAWWKLAGDRAAWSNISKSTCSSRRIHINTLCDHLILSRTRIKSLLFHVPVRVMIPSALRWPQRCAASYRTVVRLRLVDMSVCRQWQVSLKRVDGLRVRKGRDATLSEHLLADGATAIAESNHAPAEGVLAAAET